MKELLAGSPKYLPEIDARLKSRGTAGLLIGGMAEHVHDTVAATRKDIDVVLLGTIEEVCNLQNDGKNTVPGLHIANPVALKRLKTRQSLKDLPLGIFGLHARQLMGADKAAL